MYKVPKKAIEVAEIIRRDVLRPKELPVAVKLFQHHRPTLRWKLLDPIGQKAIFNFCPMGLHPRSSSACPYFDPDQFAFGERVDLQTMRAFARWWDSLEDPQKAVDALWGRSKIRDKKSEELKRGRKGKP